MKHTEVYDTLLLSPYRGVQRFIHSMLLSVANDEGVAWPSVEWLVQHIGCSRRYVLQTLAQMRADGVIEPVGTTSSGVVKYLVRSHSRGEPQFIPPVNHSSPQGRTTVHPETQRTTGEPHDLAPAARREADVRVGGLPDDEPVEQPKGTAATFKSCEVLFKKRAREIRQVNFPIGVVRRAIKVLREEKGLDYRQITEVIETFFARYSVDARNADNVAVLFRYKMHEVLNFTRKQEQIRGDGDDQSWKSDTTRKREEQMAQIVAMQKEKYGL